jgi:hypothetical protein
VVVPEVLTTADLIGWQVVVDTGDTCSVEGVVDMEEGTAEGPGYIQHTVPGSLVAAGVVGVVVHVVVEDNGL